MKQLKVHNQKRILYRNLLAALCCLFSIWGAYLVLAESDVEVCTPPITVNLRGKEAVLDQCYASDFQHDGTTYDILVYYTEDPTHQNTVDGVEQCDADEAEDDLCEHALPDSDVPGSDDNQWAVQVAEQAEIMLLFYLDRGFPVISPETHLEIWVGEDPKNGWIVAPNVLKLDDEYIATTNVLKVRANAFHEGQHLIQEKYNDTAGWQGWYTEGIARTSQDRTDAGYDVLPDSSYMSQFADILEDDEGFRSADLLTTSYRGAAFWTWFMDQYQIPSETEPGIGWDSIKSFYLVLTGSTSGLDALEVYLANNQDTTFADDFVDYTLALYAYIYNPADPRLGFVDAEINSAALGISNHTLVSGNQAFSEETATMQPRSSQYWEYVPPASCPFVAFTFEENNNSAYAFSVLTVNTGGDLEDRWTSHSPQWARTVSTSDLSRVAAVITGLDGEPDSEVTIGHGCVTPQLEIKLPTAGAPAFVGEADNPRQFQVRLAVTGQDGSGVGGLSKEDFTVELVGSDDASLPASVITAAYVGDNYWLNVEPPSDWQGAQSGQFYDLRVTLEGQSDLQNNAVLYVERQVDKLIVLDQSGSMANEGRIQAARNAATLMTFELSSADQGAFIRYEDEATLVSELEPMTGAQPFNMAFAIQATTPTGSTCIGCGLQVAAAEEDDHGIDDNLCVIALLSDGYENFAPLWADVQDEVTDNECYMDVIGLGATANEALLQEIATSSAGGGHYDFAPTVGDVPINGLNAITAPEVISITEILSWENNLSRIYDAIAIRASGRQRFLSTVGNNLTGDNPAQHVFQVDPTTDELVVSIAWQTPTDEQFVRLIDPDGAVLPLGPHQTVVPGGTAEVWRVTAPDDGQWTLLVRDLPQQYHVSASGRTLLEMQLYTGVPENNPQQGVKVPIVATFSGSGEPVIDGEVYAIITNPAGVQKGIILHDDGLHGDMDADDGVYANWYTQTTGGETAVDNPEDVVEGEEPLSRGSYLVQAIGEWQGLRREAQTSFFLIEAEDSDGDGFPNWWEVEHGLDPNDPNDPEEDPDGDGLPNRCEWTQGTNPNNPDTDGGGESDGSEVPNCVPGNQDPLDPADDRIDPLQAVLTSSEANAKGNPYVKIWLEGLPRQGIDTVDIYRRTSGQLIGPWVKIAEGVRPPTAEDPYQDVPPFPGPDPQYRVVPHNEGRTATTGRILTTAAVPLSRDPYPPSGSIIIVEEPKTASRLVTLLLSAADNAEDHGDLDHDPRPPGTEIEMIISTSPTFEDASWQPFQTQVDDFDLGDVKAGDYVTVYVRFRDEAGNISDGFEESATILFVGENTLFLPFIAR